MAAAPHIRAYPTASIGLGARSSRLERNTAHPTPSPESGDRITVTGSGAGRRPGGARRSSSDCGEETRSSGKTSAGRAENANTPANQEEHQAKPHFQEATGGAPGNPPGKTLVKTPGKTFGNATKRASAKTGGSHSGEANERGIGAGQGRCWRGGRQPHYWIALQRGERGIGTKQG